jgi:hypothetical protein
MFETAILILLYNKEIKDSSTINSLINSKHQYPNTKLVIWNNGPVNLKNLGCLILENLGYEVAVKETLNNESLAVIYNQFLAQNEANKYILLDDDSQLSSPYILASSQSKNHETSMPIITSQNVIHAPIVNNQPYSPDVNLTSKDKVMTIGSGLVIGKEISEKLKQKYGEVFDERFYFYGVDNSFCLRLFETGLTTSIKMIAGFNHSLSRLENEDNKTTKFRQLERSYSTGLELRYYFPMLDALVIILRTGLITIKKTFLGQKRSLSFINLLNAYITGKHYRAS